MKPGPPKFAETAVGFLIPPACREEVLGDLHERYTGLGQYIVDAMRTAPLVILSRIRRTTEPQVFLLEALVLYLSFLGAARYFDLKFLTDQWGLLRLAIPAAVALVTVMLGDAYANAEKQSPLKAIQGATLAIGVACLSQMALLISNPAWALPRWTMLAGGEVGLLLVSSVRMLFLPVVDRAQSANGLIFRERQSLKISPRAIWLMILAANLVVFAALSGKSWYIIIVTVQTVYDFAKKMRRNP
jgi:hypothetical protein